MSTRREDGKGIAAKAAAFQEQKIAQAKHAVYLANRNLEYWDGLAPSDAVDAMREDEELTTRLKESGEHADRRARREKEAREHEARLKMLAAFVAGAVVSAYVAVIFLRG